jgi:sirohydrochlorin cobaltochelatase
MNTTSSNSTTVFLCGHGSSDEQSQAAFAALVERFRRFSAFRVVAGTLEFSERLLDDQLANHVIPGHRLVLLPMFLAPGVHVEEDLRGALNRARCAFPETTFFQTGTLGEHEGMETLLADRVRPLLRPQSAVVLLAHGSRREEANLLVQELADGMWEQLGGPLVTAAYWKVGPDLRQTLRELSHQGLRHIVIVPYFLSEGSITERIDLEIERLSSEFPKMHILRATALGEDERLLPLMQGLVLSVLESAFVVA